MIDARNWPVRVTKFVGSLLLFCVIQHCSSKKDLTSSAFCLSFWHSGRMIEAFYRLTNVRIDQKALWLVLGFDSFVDNFEQYLFFAFSMVEFILHWRDLIVYNLLVYLSLVRYNL